MLITIKGKPPLTNGEYQRELSLLRGKTVKDAHFAQDDGQVTILFDDNSSVTAYVGELSGVMRSVGDRRIFLGMSDFKPFHREHGITPAAPVDPQA